MSGQLDHSLKEQDSPQEANVDDATEGEYVRDPGLGIQLRKERPSALANLEKLLGHHSLLSSSGRLPGLLPGNRMCHRKETCRASKRKAHWVCRNPTPAFPRVTGRTGGQSGLSPRAQDCPRAWTFKHENVFIERALEPEF